MTESEGEKVRKRHMETWRGKGERGKTEGRDGETGRERHGCLILDL